MQVKKHASQKRIAKTKFSANRIYCLTIRALHDIHVWYKCIGHLSAWFYARSWSTFNTTSHKLYIPVQYLYTNILYYKWQNVTKLSHNCIPLVTYYIHFFFPQCEVDIHKTFVYFSDSHFIQINFVLDFSQNVTSSSPTYKIIFIAYCMLAFKAF